ncbi:MAG: S-methyl-5'-thioinosine phosphorylase [Gammaproteobacteria bacterium]|nr:MAG: S-methyl-5'-thioinosine phosphorylase [Gammaproteobacteria bacterium]
MKNIAIIGGSGVIELKSFVRKKQIEVLTPYHDNPVFLQAGTFANREIIFLSRHGINNDIPAHRINYLANIYALKQQGVQNIFAINTCGGIDLKPLDIVIPNQLIDYTTNRANSYFDDEIKHLDFTYPFSEKLRHIVIHASKNCQDKIIRHATYAVSSGPRLETCAEIERFKKDGCNIVGMTAMPEASLARELSIEYICIAVVVNYAAGVLGQKIDIKDVKENNKIGTEKIIDLIKNVLQ